MRLSYNALVWHEPPPTLNVALCPCGRHGRVYLLRSALVCSTCLQAAEMAVATRIQRELDGGRKVRRVRWLNTTKKETK